MAFMILKLKTLCKPVTLLFFMIPLIAALSLGSLLEKQQSELVIPIGMVDEDQSQLSKQIIKQMKQQKRIMVQELSKSKAERLLMQGKLDSVFVIKPNFQDLIVDEERENTIELWTSPSTVASGVVQEVVASEVIKITSAVKAANQVEKIYKHKGIDAGNVWKDAMDYTEEQWNQGDLVTVEFEQSGGEETNLISLEQKEVLFVPYLGIWSFFTMLSCFIASDWILKERPILFARMMATKAGLPSYLLQTSSSYLVFHFLQTLFSFGILVYLQLIEKNVLLLMGMLLFVIFTSAIGVFIGSTMHHLGSFYVAIIVLGFILAIVGEGFIPIGTLSPTLAALSKWLPQHILWKASYAPFSELSKTVLYLVLSTFLLWGFAIRRLGVR